MQTHPYSLQVNRSSSRNAHVTISTVMDSNTVETSGYRLLAITPILPAGSGVGQPFNMADLGPPLSLGHAETASSSSVLGRFRKGEPTALGTVQIMVGFLLLLFGIVLAFCARSLSVYSGIFVWGAVFYIIAGCLTVSAGRTLNKCLVKGSLGMNIVAAIVSLIQAILCSMDACRFFVYYFHYSYQPSYPSQQYQDHFVSRYSFPPYQECHSYLSQAQGVSGLLAVFCLLEFTVCVSVSAFACKATCYTQPERVFIIGDQFTNGNAEIPVVSTPPYETGIFPKAPEEARNQTESEMNVQPPPYTPGIQ